MAVYEAEISAEVVGIVTVSGKTIAEAEQKAKAAFEEEAAVHVIKWRGLDLRRLGNQRWPVE